MKIKIKTNLVSGIIMGLVSLILLVVMPKQVRVPAFDSGAPSPRIIPGICLVLMLVFSIVLIIQSLVFKKEKIVEFDWAVEKPAIVLILIMCVYVALIIYIGYIPASIITFLAVQFYCGERKLPIYIYTVAAAVLIYFLFKNVFYISLPAGPFFGG
ncbi:MAG: tripartite tricarboxylate transporter TctB family protein [Oscillospiraceae bacterium]|nr:tripartite tricarboxylate transporter TctB family protein [Oscillospiraceae bacterium]